MSDCKHENAYYNKVTVNLAFWVCPDCKQDFDEDPNKIKPSDLPSSKIDWDDEWDDWDQLPFFDVDNNKITYKGVTIGKDVRQLPCGLSYL